VHGKQGFHLFIVGKFTNERSENIFHINESEVKGRTDL